MNIFDEFEKTSKKTWLSKIDKDLGVKSISDCVVDLGNEIKISPFFHKEDKIELNIPNNKENNSWLINEQIDADNCKNLNIEILKALEGGASSITLIVHENWKMENFHEAFKGVYLNLIFINFQFDIKEQNIKNYFENFDKYLLEINLKPSNISGSIYKENTSISKEHFNGFVKIKNHTIISIKSKTSIKQIVDYLIVAENLLSLSNDKKELIQLSKNIIFEVEISNIFYLNIAKIRALKILWKTILDSYQIEYSIFVKAVINIDNETNENTAIIAATNQAISATIAGIEMLEIKPFEHHKTEDGNGFSRRIARNIQNILSVESQFSKVIDPVAGSYFIDNLTKTICENSWAEFQVKVDKK